jgi:large subunit ribosomal protein L9
MNSASPLSSSLIARGSVAPDGELRYTHSAMKVILLRDVARLGRKGDVKQVPDGHAQNFLIPRGFAERATTAALKRLEAQQETIEVERTAARERLSALREALSATPVVITASANEQGHLFKAVREKDIAEALSARADFPVTSEAIALARPIKEVGTYDVVLGDGGEEGTVSVVVEAA